MFNSPLPPAIPPDGFQLVQMPCNWVQVLDRLSGNVYYYNSITGAMQWELPFIQNVYAPYISCTPYGHYQQDVNINRAQVYESKTISDFPPLNSKKTAINRSAPEVKGISEKASYPSKGRLNACRHEIPSVYSDEIHSRRFGGRAQNFLNNNTEYVEGIVHRFRSTSSVEPKTIARLTSMYDNEVVDEFREPDSVPGNSYARDRANTTSSVYRSRIASTIFQPDAENQLRWVAAVLHAHMVAFATSLSWNKNPRQLSVFDECKTRSIDSIPTPETVFRFINKIYKGAEMVKECIIMSLIYLERLLQASNGKLNLHLNNWKPIVLTCMVVASKVWDDLSMQNGDFSLMCPEYSVQRINELEAAFLDIIEYRVRVHSSTYAKYYFQLRAIGQKLGLSLPSRLTSSKDSHKVPWETLDTEPEAEPGAGRPRRQTFSDGSSPS